MKRAKILLLTSFDEVFVPCPHCEAGEEHPRDEQRHHLQTFDIIKWLPDREGENEVSIMQCHNCNNVFEIEWDYNNIDNEEKEMIDLSPLKLSKEKEEQVQGILSGKVNPEFYEAVRTWVNQCYNKPSEDELRMCAINAILEGYGVESLEGEWRNDYWANIVAVYVNMGDTYLPTIVQHRDQGWLVSSWGDLVENDKTIK